MAKKHAAELAVVKEAEETERAQREAQFRDGEGQFRIHVYYELKNATNCHFNLLRVTQLF